MKNLLFILFCFPFFSIAQTNDKNYTLDRIMINFPEWDNYIKMVDKDISLALYKRRTNIEQVALLKYYQNDSLIYESAIYLRLSGNASRKLPQKSIAIKIIEDTLIPNKFIYNLFPSREFNQIEEFVIRAHGNTLKKTFFNDAIANSSLFKHTDLEFSAYRPIVLYINEEYKGLYNIREKKDKDVIANAHNILKEDIELFTLVNNIPDPSNTAWDSLIKYCSNNDLSQEDSYQYVSRLVDVDNFIDYNIAECFFSNTDWPRTNVKIWRPNNGKFRFMFFDCDRGMISTTFNQLEHITGQDQWAKMRGDKKIDLQLTRNTILVRELSKNKNFCKQFAIRYQDLLNTAFTTETMHGYIKNAKKLIDGEINNHINIWGDSDSFNSVKSYEHWIKNINILKQFFVRRPSIEFQHLQEKWVFGDLVDLEIAVNDARYGSLQINTINALQYDFQGKFLNKLPITLEAIPRSGYKFDYWEGVDSKKTKVIFQPYNIISSKITAHFKLID